MSTAPYRQPALPGMKTAAADAGRSAGRLCASWTDAEVAFADACFNAWNTAFKNHGTRANRTRHAYFVAVQLLKWIHSAGNDGEKMTEQDVLVAIAAYAKDPWIREKCGGRWKAFADWFKDCPDAVDKQLTRLNRRRGGAAPTPKANIAAAAAAGDPQAKLTIAKEWLNKSGWASLIDAAAHRRNSDGNWASLPEFLRIRRVEQISTMERYAGGSPRQLLKAEIDDLDARLKWIEDFKSIDPKVRRSYHERARAVLSILPESRQRIAMTLALAIEIHRYEKSKPTTQKASVG